MSEYIVEINGQVPDTIYERELTEIVRCDSCKYYYERESSEVYPHWHWCDKLTVYMPPNGFCSLGERAGRMREFVVNMSGDWANKQCEKLAEIVRCRDCKHFTYAGSEHDNNDWCAKHEHIAWSVNGFCAWGERR